ncbi:MAG: ABC transporter substrate-binding protein [Acidimicrobiales bacterium]
MNRLTKVLGALAVASLAVVAACSSDSKTTTSSSGSSGSSSSSSVKVTIGAQDFGESAILAEIYKQGLAAKGFSTSTQKLGGFRDLEIKAFDDGTINFAPEYSASTLEFLNGKKGEATSDIKTTVEKLQIQLTAKKLKALAASNAVDTNAFVVTKATADKVGLKTLSDLASKGADLKLGAPADCETNAFCLPGLKAKYGLDLSGKLQALETTQIADALDAGTVDIGLLFSTDGRIAAKGYVLLQDDKKMLAADNVLPVVSEALAANADLVKATDAITAKLTSEKLIALNKRFDVDKEDAAVIAKSFLTDEKLI